MCHITANKQIESAQRKFTKILPGLKDLGYSDRLVRSGIERLELRRIKQDLILTYKIYFGLMSAIKPLIYSLPPTQTMTQEVISINSCRVIVAGGGRKIFFFGRRTEEGGG